MASTVAPRQVDQPKTMYHAAASKSVALLKHISPLPLAGHTTSTSLLPITEALNPNTLSVFPIPATAPSPPSASQDPPRPNSMVHGTAVVFLALGASIIAVQVPSFLDKPGTTMTPGQAFPFNGSLQVMLPLATMESIFTALAFVYGHPHHAGAAAGAGAGNWRLSELVMFILCPLIGRLEFYLFVQKPAGGLVDDGAQVRALGMAAVDVLPAAATVTFFLGMALVFVQVRAGGGGGAGAVAGGPIQVVVRIVTMMALGAAAALINLMAMAVVYTK